jgi:hypothetical protein
MPVYDLSCFIPEKRECGERLRKEYGDILLKKYLKVRKHIYRTDRAGKVASYVYAFKEMVEAFIDLWQFYEDFSKPEHNYDGPDKFFHEVHHLLLRAEDNKTEHGEVEHKKDMIKLDRYLNQIHVFLETKRFDKFDVYLETNDGRGGWFTFRYYPEDKCYSVSDECLDKYTKIWGGWLSKENIERLNDFPTDRIHRCGLSIVRRLKERKKQKKNETKKN